MLRSLEKVMLFPFSNELLGVYKFREMLPCQIQSVVSFKSWGFVGKNAATIEGGEPGPHVISGDFEKELKYVDSVILGSFSKYYGDEGIIDTYLNKIYEAGKNVLVLDVLEPEKILYYKQLYLKKNKQFLALHVDFQQDQLTPPLSVPVLGIFGSGEGVGKLETQVHLYKALKNQGYRISMIGPNPQITLLGGYTYPPVLYQETIGENQKVRILRAFAHMIISKDQSDLLIISAPYGMNNLEEDRWGFSFGKTGLVAHIVIEAMKPDANLFCFAPGDLKWSKRSLQTMEVLSAAPTLAVVTKRIMRIPINAFEKFKYGLFDDEMFDFHRDLWRKELHPNIIDLEKVSERQLVILIEDAFDAEKRLESLI